MKEVQELLITQKEASFQCWVSHTFWAMGSGMHLIMSIKSKKEIMGLHGPENRAGKNLHRKEP